MPNFVRAGGRGGPLRPSGSSSVPTNVRPYRVGSGALRVVVSVFGIAADFPVSLYVVILRHDLVAANAD